MSGTYHKQESHIKNLIASVWFSGLGASLVFLSIVLSPAWCYAAEEMAHEHMNHQGGHMMMDEHAAHRAAMDKSGYSVTTQNYTVPDVTLIDETGAGISLQSLLDVEKPIALNFIFTTCNTICPVMTATFAQMRQQLGEAGKGLQLVSISIDPEYDRPQVLKKYAKLFGASDGWTFLTGDSKDISQVLHNFNALSGSKMNHRPLTLLKNPQSAQWIRIDGLASSTDLTQEITTRLLN